jgi:LAS superfamily LD-carboxypeptidase LdcB
MQEMLDTNLHAAIIKLVIAYTLLGAFIFTVVITCLSLIGLVRFAVANQQSKLFATLIVEIVIIGVGAFSNFLKFDALNVQKAVQAPAIQAAAKSEARAESINTKFSTLVLNEQLQTEVVRGLKPEAAQLAQQLIDVASLRGIEVRIIAGYRSNEQQNELYAQGRTKPGPKVTNVIGGCSVHNTGLAFDIGVFQEGKYLDESPMYSEVGQIGKSLGLEWGGDKRTVIEEPHFETRDAQEALRILCAKARAGEHKQ